jgi:nucleoid DNA-binding protein
MTNLNDLNKATLSVLVGERLHITKVQAESTVNFIFDTVRETIVRGNKVSIAKFGIFTSRMASARTGRNPRTGEKVEVPAYKKVKFASAKEFKELLNEK